MFWNKSCIKLNQRISELVSEKKVIEIRESHYKNRLEELDKKHEKLVSAVRNLRHYTPGTIPHEYTYFGCDDVFWLEAKVAELKKKREFEDAANKELEFKAKVQEIVKEVLEDKCSTTTESGS